MDRLAGVGLGLLAKQKALDMRDARLELREHAVIFRPLLRRSALLAALVRLHAAGSGLGHRALLFIGHACSPSRRATRSLEDRRSAGPSPGVMDGIPFRRRRTLRATGLSARRGRKGGGGLIA